MIEVICVGSGPSLTKEQCRQIEGRRVIAVNSSWKMVPFCDVIYAGDPDWWKHNIDDIDVGAHRVTCLRGASMRYSLIHHRVFGAYNSGLRAIQYAIFEMKADRVILLGYDCRVDRGIHWHGKHQKTKNPDTKTCAKWKRQFARMDTGGAQVINCTPGSAINCFPKMKLEDALCLRNNSD